MERSLIFLKVQYIPVLLMLVYAAWWMKQMTISTGLEILAVHQVLILDHRQTTQVEMVCPK